jgi:hypothetical protein
MTRTDREDFGDDLAVWRVFYGCRRGARSRVEKGDRQGQDPDGFRRPGREMVAGTGREEAAWIAGRRRS